MTELLSCGHPPSEHGSGIGTGYAIRHGDGAKLCYECAYQAELADLRIVGLYTGYLSNGARSTPTGYELTTWTGHKLATVTRLARGHHNIGGFLYRFRAVDVHGQHWFGTSPGPGMYALMRKCKVQPVKLTRYRVYWGPTGETLTEVHAKDAKQAKRMALSNRPQYRRYKGEVGVEVLS